MDELCDKHMAELTNADQKFQLVNAFEGVVSLVSFLAIRSDLRGKKFNNFPTFMNEKINDEAYSRDAILEMGVSDEEQTRIFICAEEFNMAYCRLMEESASKIVKDEAVCSKSDTSEISINKWEENHRLRCKNMLKDLFKPHF